MSAFARILECLRGHNGCVHEARPCRKGDQAAILGWITRSKQQENTECGVYAKDHLLVFRLVRLPSPPARPKKHHQRVDTKQKDYPYQHQHNLQGPFSIHRVLLCLFLWKGVNFAQNFSLTRRERRPTSRILPATARAAEPTECTRRRPCRTEY